MLTLALMATICAQAADISGIVVDKANQELLIGATVMAGDKGTTTDIDGKFAIKGITTKNIHLIINNGSLKNGLSAKPLCAASQRVL